MVKYCWLYRCLHGCVLSCSFDKEMFIIVLCRLSVFYSDFWTSNCKQELFLDKVAAAGDASGRLTSNYSLPLYYIPLFPCRMLPLTLLLMSCFMFCMRGLLSYVGDLELNRLVNARTNKSGLIHGVK